MDTSLYGLKEEIPLEERQRIAKDALRFIARVCEQSGIPFFLIGGSALGAVRHGDIIPWDDDIDIGIPRKAYLRLLEVFPNDDRYRLLSSEASKTYTQPMAKVVDLTTRLQEPLTYPHEDMGVFVDIFPLDYVDSGRLRLKAALLLKKIYNYGFVVDWHSEDARKLPLLKRQVGRLSRALVRRSDCRILSRAIRRILLRKEQESSDLIINLWGAWQERELVPATWFGSGFAMPFGDESYPVPKQYDKYLRRLYGDYMVPPSNPPHSHGKAWYRERPDR